MKLTRSDAVNGCNGDHEAVLSGASPLDFREQLLLDRVHQLRSEISRVEHEYE